MARALLARVFWLQGFADKAHAEAEASLEELHDSRHQLSLCRVLHYGMCRIAPLTGDFEAAGRALARLVEVATRLNVPFWKLAGRFLEGKLMVARREFAQGAAILRDAFETCRKTGWQFSYPEFKGVYAEALAGLGRTGEALAIVNEAIADAGERENGQWWYVPEVLRVKGEVCVQDGSDRSLTMAEECFGQAGELARQQGALFWELRAAMSLARLLGDQGRSADATARLWPIYGRFTEGFGTADLIAAKQLLDDLSVAGQA